MGSYAIKFVVAFHLTEHSWEEFYDVKPPTPGPKICKADRISVA
jgi:hypothetical protein